MKIVGGYSQINNRGGSNYTLYYVIHQGIVYGMEASMDS